MKYLQNKCIGIMKFFVFLSVMLFFSLNCELNAQEPPPRPVEVTVTPQILSFGTFTQGPSGGTVTVTAGGIRSSTPDIILLSMGSFSPALFHLVANPGTVISIVNGPDVSLPGSNGGFITLTIGATSPGPTFVINTVPPAYTLLYIGGTLTVGSPIANPPGNYSGLFYIIFMQE
jgi:hypothetical protein